MTMKQLGDVAGPSSDPTTNTKLPTHRLLHSEGHESWDEA